MSPPDTSTTPAQAASPGRPDGSPVPAGQTWKKLSLDDLRRMSREAIQEACERACHSAYLGDHTSICRVLTRYLMHVDTRDIGLTPHLLMTGYWETWITQAICQFVRPGMCVVDVGANNGYFSLLLADLVGPEGKMLALEPNPPTFALLRRNVVVNGFAERATLFAAAAHSQDCEHVALHVPTEDPGLASIVPGVVHDRLATSMTTIECPAMRLDSILQQEPRVDFIKIDAEGAEPAIWEGMSGVLRRHPGLTVALEFTPARYADAAGFLRQAERDGFTLREVRPDGTVMKATADEILAHAWVMLWLQRG